MLDPRIMRLHLEISSVPQMRNLDAESVEYFWYSIASCIAVHRPEWCSDEVMEFISKFESRGEVDDA